MSLKLGNKSFIIAEAGTCHAHHSPTERFFRALDYVQIAALRGADAIKFQMFLDPNPETMFCWIDGDEERSIRWKQSVLDLDHWLQVKEEADARGIMFLSSAFEYETVRWQSELNVEATKVASRAAGYLDAYKDAPKPLLVSNGMYSVKPAEDQIIFQCEANYPSTTRWRGDDWSVGFSDHSGNPWRVIDAMARGCKLIEVHFYINPSHAGPDYPASLTPDELSLVCEARDAFYEM